MPEISNNDLFNYKSSAPGTIIPEKNKKVIGFFDAIHQIQLWRAIELEGVELQPDRFTYRDRIEYFNVGMKHGAIELLITIFLFPLLAFIIPDYIYFFTGHPVDLFIEVLLVSIGLISMVLYLFLNLTLASLYTGIITKLAILSILLGRTAMIFLIGGFSIVFFYFIYIMTGIVGIGHYLVTFFSWARYLDRTLPPQRAYYSLLFYKLIRPSFLEIVFKSIIVYSLSAMIPLFTIGCKAFYMKYYCNNKTKK